MALPAPPTPELTGYATAPGWSSPENTVAITGVGSARPFGYKKQRREPTMNGGLSLSTGQASKDIVLASLRYDTTIGTARQNCLPVISIESGYRGRCGGSALRVTGRYGMMSQVAIAWAQNQMNRCTYQAEVLTLQTATTGAAPADADIIAAGGNPFSWYENAWTLTTGGTGTTGLDNILNTATLTISNAIERDGCRGIITDDTNPLSRTAYRLTAMAQTITLDLNTQDVLPYFDGLTVMMGTGAGSWGLQLGGISLNTASQDETDASARFGFSSQYMVATATYVAGA